MSEANSTGELAGIIVASGITAASFGKAIQWLAGLSERRGASRAAKLQQWQEELHEREAAIDAKTEKRLATLEAQALAHGEQNMALRMAFELVASALRAIDPRNTALSRAEQLLQSSFPLAVIVPADMSSALRALDTKDLAATAAARRTETPE